MALTVRIQLKKGYTKNVCVHLCSKAEVVKPNSKMSLWYPKNSGDVAGASKITYILVWQFFSTNKFKKNIYYLLLHSTTATQKLYHTLPQLLKNYEYFTDQIQDGWRRPLQYWKKPTSGIVLQEFTLVNLRCLYKDNLKRTVMHTLTIL